MTNIVINNSACFQYLKKFYQAKTGLLILSVSSLVCCYLAIGLIFCFSSLLEKRSTDSFNRFFFDAQYVLTNPKGILFNAGDLQTKNEVSPPVISNFRQTFPKAVLRTIPLENDKNVPAYLIITGTLDTKNLLEFCAREKIRLFSSYNHPSQLSGFNGCFYVLNDHRNRFSFFSFKNQISASVLGENMSSAIGAISKLIFSAALLFTFYITLLYFSERKSDYIVFIISGHIDLNFRITYIDCIIQNIVAFLLTLTLVPVILRYFTANINELAIALQGLIYIIPYFLVITIVQILVLLNQSLSYAAKIS